ncbi:hypothetical protein VTI28DRAFT_7966 [Corynascus sepedonium]
MATNRLTFLYPHLFRTGGRWTEPAASQAVRGSHRNSSARPPSCQHAVAPFTTPSAGRQAAFAKRAGKAIEPLPFDSPKQQPKSEGGPSQKQETTKSTPSSTRASPAPSPSPSSSSPSSSSTSSGEASHQFASSSKPNLPPTIELPPPADIDPITQTKKGSPMDEILHMGPPPDSLPSPPPGALTSEMPSDSASTSGAESTEPQASNTKPPHLVPTPYVHHFDSYTLVKQLTAGGYTLPQAISSMKAIRTILAHNLDVAQSGLVSKADVENETYLFRAACSELSAEVRNNRRVADEQLRQQRTLLQHEVDILAQRLNQELLTLNDNVRGMFNDRRMAVREEQKAVESRIQQINYKISVTLNSDAKSNIEGLRWVLIRRSVLGIIFMAVLTLGTIRYATYIRHKRQKEAEQRAKEAEEMKKHLGRVDSSPGPDAAEMLAAS